MSESVAFLGTGQLGTPMARNLLDAGVALRVYNRTAAKADSLVAHGAQRATSPAEAVTPGGIVATLLWDGASVESVVRSDGFLARLGAGGLHVSMSTILPQHARDLATLHAEHGVAYVEAPIFGRPEAAAARQLWMPIAGPAAAKARVTDLLTKMGVQGIFDFGEQVGAATTVKLAGNFLIVSATRSLVEALALVDAQGVDVSAAVDMLTSTLFTAPIYKSYGKLIATKTAPFSQTEIPKKDLGLFGETAKQGSAPAPIAELLLRLLQAQVPG